MVATYTRDLQALTPRPDRQAATFLIWPNFRLGDDSPTEETKNGSKEDSNGGGWE